MSGMACDGERGCTAPIHYVDSKGYAYCQRHGDRLKAGGRTGVRKLRQSDVASRQAEEAKMTPDMRAVNRGFQTLTMVEFSYEDYDEAERIARRRGVGAQQGAFTDSHDLTDSHDPLPGHPTRGVSRAELHGTCRPLRSSGALHERVLRDPSRTQHHEATRHQWRGQGLDRNS